MPWVRKHPRPARLNWIVGILGGLLIGLLLGYERWGSTAAVVSIVEKELGTTEARITEAENRLIRLEAKLLSQGNNPSSVEARGNGVNADKPVSQAPLARANNPLPAAADTY
jgi:hypothetical protein